MARAGRLSEANILLQNGAHGTGGMGGPTAAELQLSLDFFHPFLHGHSFDFTCGQPKYQGIFPMTAAGSLPCAEKASQSVSKYVCNSADATPGQAKLPAWATTREDPSQHRLLSPTNLQHPKPPEITSLSSDKKKQTKPSTENSTGLRKYLLQYGGPLPLEPATEGPSPTSFDLNQANRKQADRRLAEAANSVSAHFQHAASSYHKITSLLGAHPFLDSGTAESADANMLDHFNRPGKIYPYKSVELLKIISKPSWVTNRQPPSLPYHFSMLKKGADMEKACLTECRKERDEVEAYCTSEFGKLSSMSYTEPRPSLFMYSMTLHFCF
ncbi:hypothetical protein CIB84_001985 [Bambusicola thoracicus]|uniref:Uncharacterized protein n=1 Tax=Bambusicola thoracicus TaxID=9083 RepID=A0A2P4TD16_BAMTH|nr:hypothetical protein CIB84_001985 [Bambusicola thoracicus]